MANTECLHNNVVPAVVDQTLGVDCKDCGAMLAACWMDEHVPESLWNRACANDQDQDFGKPCAENRDDVCAVCQEKIEPKEASDG